MRKNTPEQKSIYIEKMHGFEEVAKDLGEHYGCDFIYGDIEVLTISESPAEVVGIVKGPRTKLDARILERIANVASNPTIGYIGRHPEKILDEDVEYETRKINGQEILLVQVGNKEILIVPMNESPLSEAAAAYVSGMVDAVLQSREKEIEHLTIEGGNDFNKRNSHSFPLESAGLNFENVTLGVVGVGDVGLRVANVFQKNGAKVLYTDTGKKPEKLNGGIKRVRGIEKILHRPSDVEGSYVVSLHLPRNVRVPLTEANDIDILVNTGSGSNIDEKELMQAVNEGRIKHVILDVFKHETENFSNNEMSKHVTDNRLTMTPHIAYNHPEAILKTLQTTVDNIMRVRNKSEN